MKVKLHLKNTWGRRAHMPIWTQTWDAAAWKQSRHATSSVSSLRPGSGSQSESVTPTWLIKHGCTEAVSCVLQPAASLLTWQLCSCFWSCLPSLLPSIKHCKAHSLVSLFLEEQWGQSLDTKHYCTYWTHKTEILSSFCNLNYCQTQVFLQIFYNKNLAGRGGGYSSKDFKTFVKGSHFDWQQRNTNKCKFEFEQYFYKCESEQCQLWHDCIKGQ